MSLTDSCSFPVFWFLFLLLEADGTVSGLDGTSTDAFVLESSRRLALQQSPPAIERVRARGVKPSTRAASTKKCSCEVGNDATGAPASWSEGLGASPSRAHE